MTDDLDYLGLTPAADFTVEAVEEVKATAYKLPSPTLVPNAVRPEVVVVERRERRSSVTDETAGGMGVHAEQEGDEEVVSVPESLERLLSDPVVSSGVDEQHAQQHDVSSDTTGFGVVNLKGNLGTDLSALDVEEAVIISTRSISEFCGSLLHVMSTRVKDREEQHGVCDLLVEPLVLVEWRPSSLRS